MLVTELCTASIMHYHGNLLRPWPQKLTVLVGQCWHLDPCAGPPVLIKISADNSPLNQLPVKSLFFSLIIKTFCHEHQRIVHEKAINLSVWIKEICIILVKLHIICFRMQRVNLHNRPSIIQVCALNHAKVGDADLGYPQSHAIVMRKTG